MLIDNAITQVLTKKKMQEIENESIIRMKLMTKIITMQLRRAKVLTKKKKTLKLEWQITTTITVNTDD